MDICQFFVRVIVLEFIAIFDIIFDREFNLKMENVNESKELFRNHHQGTHKGMLL